MIGLLIYLNNELIEIQTINLTNTISKTKVPGKMKNLNIFQNKCKKDLNT